MTSSVSTQQSLQSELQAEKVTSAALGEELSASLQTLNKLEDELSGTRLTLTSTDDKLKAMQVLSHSRLTLVLSKTNVLSKTDERQQTYLNIFIRWKMILQKSVIIAR